ncbi:MAG TPA: metalloregulator ArsR/SmtB family transcription factor [Vicinamibacteria bacterium]|nr:metalloregulator ArsR/SmtB family transcription factor [Vicinamibacteria bacterium]
MSPARPSPRPAGARFGVPASIFAALGDGTRLRLVSRLCAGGPMSIARLTDGTHVTRQAVTKHLQVLADAGLVRGRRQGRQSLWELEPRPLEAARRYLDLISKRWDDTLGRLKAAVEEQQLRAERDSLPRSERGFKGARP